MQSDCDVTIVGPNQLILYILSVPAHKTLATLHPRISNNCTGRYLANCFFVVTIQSEIHFPHNFYSDSYLSGTKVFMYIQISSQFDVKICNPRIFSDFSNALKKMNGNKK